LYEFFNFAPKAIKNQLTFPALYKTLSSFCCPLAGVMRRKVLGDGCFLAPMDGLGFMRKNLCKKVFVKNDGQRAGCLKG
jgi:hypothetical protein